MKCLKIQDTKKIYNIKRNFHSNNNNKKEKKNLQNLYSLSKEMNNDKQNFDEVQPKKREREGAKRKQQQPKDKLDSCRNKKIKSQKKTGMSLDNKKKYLDNHWE